MSRDWVKDVGDFHAACGVEEPGFMKANRLVRLKLLKEELDELADAENAGDSIEIADAIADIIYILVGTARVYGIPLAEVWDEVHRSNMAKVAPDGRVKMRWDGKIQKPDGWTPPDIAGVLGRGES